MVTENKYTFLGPALKWVGGKRQLLDDIRPLIPQNISEYIEPFVGGGAVLFDLKPNKALINDYNEELINVYKTIRDSPQELLSLLEHHKQQNSSEHFYAVRAWDRDDSVFTNLSKTERAARIIYLNKTCYNGLFRVNKSGQFNTPYGKYKNPNIVNKPTIIDMSKYFNENNITIMSGDYRKALKNIKEGAFVYFDPPYVPISETAAYTSYTAGGFSLEQQIELKETCDELNKMGIKFLLSNSNHKIVEDLYKDYNIIKVKAKRAINSKGNQRGKIDEVLVMNYEANHPPYSQLDIFQG